MSGSDCCDILDESFNFCPTCGDKIVRKNEMKNVLDLLSDHNQKGWVTLIDKNDIGKKIEVDVNGKKSAYSGKEYHITEKILRVIPKGDLSQIKKDQNAYKKLYDDNNYHTPVESIFLNTSIGWVNAINHPTVEDLLVNLTKKNISDPIIVYELNILNQTKKENDVTQLTLDINNSHEKGTNWYINQIDTLKMITKNKIELYLINNRFYYNPMDAFNLDEKELPFKLNLEQNNLGKIHRIGNIKICVVDECSIKILEKIKEISMIKNKIRELIRTTDIESAYDWMGIGYLKRGEE